MTLLKTQVRRALVLRHLENRVTKEFIDVSSYSGGLPLRFSPVDRDEKRRHLTCALDSEK